MTLVSTTFWQVLVISIFILSATFFFVYYCLGIDAVQSLLLIIPLTASCFTIYKFWKSLSLSLPLNFEHGFRSAKLRKFADCFSLLNIALPTMRDQELLICTKVILKSFRTFSLLLFFFWMACRCCVFFSL